MTDGPFRGIVRCRGQARYADRFAFEVLKGFYFRPRNKMKRRPRVDDHESFDRHAANTGVITRLELRAELGIAGNQSRGSDIGSCDDDTKVQALLLEQVPTLSIE